VVPDLNSLRNGLVLVELRGIRFEEKGQVFLDCGDGSKRLAAFTLCCLRTPGSVWANAIPEITTPQKCRGPLRALLFSFLILLAQAHYPLLFDTLPNSDRSSK